ncbi:MAG: T9SS type A sorting domain-containing protein, partial [Bacteroidales bacterium]|nr:T9SS type A sorting domain-containing protein [Bacteroidales bacterium]
VTVTWNAHGSHTAWTVTYGPMGMPRDSFAVVACLQPSLTITGLDSTRIYDISVQAQCDYHVSDLEPFDADVLNNRDTTFFSEQGKHLYLRGGNLVAINDVTPNDGILLRPNPADRLVTVSATMPIKHVEVYDLAGRLVEARQPSGTTLQLNLKSYQSGAYLVKVTTANGTTTKKLVVR